MIHQQAITGQESVADEMVTPLQCLQAFYRAFNTRDMSLMSANWEPVRKRACRTHWEK